MNTEELIGLLAADAAPPWRVGALLAAAIGLGAAIAAAIFLAGIGVRPDLAAAVTHLRFLLKPAIALTLATTAIAAVSRLARPDGALGRAGMALLAAPALLVVAAAAELMVVPRARWMTLLIGHNARWCLTLIPLLALAPLACLLLALRRAAPARPRLAGAVAGLAASGIGAALYASHCPDDSPLFVITWYSAATLIVTGAGYAAGGRWLRW